jgi:8-oxo-dGTP diphosphatase
MTTHYPKPSVTVDCVVFRYSVERGYLQVLLIERAGEPFKGRWALPGGFVNMSEGLDRAAARELREETGLTGSYLEQLYTFGDPKRDPRGRVITVAYMALLRSTDDSTVKGSSDARRAEWFDVQWAQANAHKLAFDHRHILAKGIERLQSKVRYAPVLFDLVPPEFTISELQNVYEEIIGKDVDARHFRRKVEHLAGLRKLREARSTGRRPASLYTYEPPSGSSGFYL